MPGAAAHPPRKVPAQGEQFNPREIFGGIGVFIPERVAASTVLSMTAKVCYGHLLRRTGKNDRCWPSHRDIADSTGVKERQVMRALKELAGAELIKAVPRTDTTGRQTSNAYEFIWGPILQGEGDTSDTLPRDKSDRGRVSDLTSTGLTEMTPLEVSKKNHHQGSTQKEDSKPAESGTQSCSQPDALNPLPCQGSKSDDDDSQPTKYASGKDELKALTSKAGQPLRVADLDSIEYLLACPGVTWEDFVAEARQHSWSRIKNPVGFLKSLAKKFRAKTQRASAPITAAEAEEKNYRCSSCGSRVRGEGAILDVNGKPAPCRCASPEYIARMRERGIFSEETQQ